jgi:hypothetical protein
MLRLHAAALALRREVLLDEADTLAWLDIPERDDVLAYRRGRVTVVTVFGERPFAPPPSWGRVLLATGATEGATLSGESAAWLLADDPQQLG